jgi:hypothetical protein
MTKKISPTDNLCPGQHLIMGNDARMLHLREGTAIEYVLVLVPDTYPYLNLCLYTYISFSKTRLHPVRCTVYLECQICNLNFVIIKISIKKRIQNIIILKLKVANTNRTTKDI